MPPATPGFDPVEPNSLQPATLTRNADEAVRAIAAVTTLDELKELRLAHAGDRSPLALANREIGALPPQAKADAGRRVGQARAAVSAALTERETVLLAQRDARMLVEEAVDVTLPWDRAPRGARHPLTTLTERIVDVFIAMGWEIAEGPEVEAEWFNFDALNMDPRPPGPRPCRTPSSSTPPTPAWCCAPTPRRCRPARC